MILLSVLPFNESINRTRPSMFCRTVPISPLLKSLYPLQGDLLQPPVTLRLVSPVTCCHPWLGRPGPSSLHLSLITAVTTQSALLSTLMPPPSRFQTTFTIERGEGWYFWQHRHYVTKSEIHNYSISLGPFHFAMYSFVYFGVYLRKTDTFPLC